MGERANGKEEGWNERMSPRAIIAVRKKEEGKAKSNQRKYAITQSVHFPRNAAAAAATHVWVVCLDTNNCENFVVDIFFTGQTRCVKCNLLH